MAQVAVVGGAGCKVRSVPNGQVGDVFTMLPSGEPGWAANTGGPGGGTMDLCALNVAQITCLTQAVDPGQLTAAQVTDLATALRGELVQDVFGVDLGYLLPV